jgi:hypothetical protein
MHKNTPTYKTALSASLYDGADISFESLEFDERFIIQKYSQFSFGTVLFLLLCFFFCTAAKKNLAKKCGKIKKNDKYEKEDLVSKKKHLTKFQKIGKIQ